MRLLIRGVSTIGPYQSVCKRSRGFQRVVRNNQRIARAAQRVDVKRTAQRMQTRRKPANSRRLRYARERSLCSRACGVLRRPVRLQFQESFAEYLRLQTAD